MFRCGADLTGKITVIPAMPLRNYFLFPCLFFLLTSAALPLGAQIPAPADERPLAVAATSIIADLVEVIGGGLVRVETLVPAEEDPHGYRPTAANLEQLRGADLVLRNGLGLDEWLDPPLEEIASATPVFTLTTGIQPITPGANGPTPDPHAWMTAANGITYLKNVLRALVTIDSNNADIYQFNHDIYLRQLEEVEQATKNRIAAVPEQQRYLVPVHGLIYFTRHYGIRTEEEQENLSIAIDSLYVDALSDPAGPAATYLDLLRHNTDLVISIMESNPPFRKISADRPGHGKYLLAALIVLLISGFIYRSVRRK